MKEDFRFYFDLSHVKKEPDALIAVVTTRVKDPEGFDAFEGPVRVKVNDIGIFPFPADVVTLPLPTNDKRRFLAEMKKYIRPQRRFLREHIRE